jgi:transcriptional regulator with XRE-family HTH domain
VGKPVPYSEIGERVRLIRRRRGLTQDVLAGRAGVSKPYVSQLERGIRAFERRSLIQRFADALECSVLDLTGEPYAPVDRVVAEGMAAIPGVERALHDCTLDDVPDVPTRPLDRLAVAVDQANQCRDQTHYGVAGRELGALLTELQVIAATGHPDEQRGALTQLVELGIVAYELAKNLGYPALAADAAERGYQAAASLGDLPLLAFASWYRALALMRLGAARRSGRILATTIADLEPVVDPTAEATLSAEVYGLLHMTSALHAARQGAADDAYSHLSEAAAVAERTGERNSLYQHFGPTNVAVWRTAIGVELCEGAKVVENASGVNADILDSRNRAAALNMDFARALSQEGGTRDREAVQYLDRADRIAPSRIRQDPIARSLLDTLDSRARLSMWELGSLRHRFGLASAAG